MNSPGNPAQQAFVYLKGNGKDFVDKPNGMYVVYKITKPGKPDIVGSVLSFLVSDLDGSAEQNDDETVGQDSKR